MLLLKFSIALRPVPFAKKYRAQSEPKIGIVRGSDECLFVKTSGFGQASRGDKLCSAFHNRGHIRMSLCPREI